MDSNSDRKCGRTVDGWEIARGSLERDGALHGIQSIREFDKHSVAYRFDLASAVSTKNWIRKPCLGFEKLQGRPLVGLSSRCESLDVREHYGGQSAGRIHGARTGALRIKGSQGEDRDGGSAQLGNSSPPPALPPEVVRTGSTGANRLSCYPLWGARADGTPSSPEDQAEEPPSTIAGVPPRTLLME